MPFPFDHEPAVLWTLHRDGRKASCVVAFVPHGVQVRVLRGDTPLMALTFPDATEARAWADERRQRFLTFDPTTPAQ